MTCQDIKNRLEKFLDGELPEDEVQSITAHLQSCESCNAQLERIRALDQAVRAEPVKEPPPEYWNQLSADISKRLANVDMTQSHKKVSWTERIHEILWPRRISYRVVGLAATAVITIFVIRTVVLQHDQLPLPPNIAVEKSAEQKEALPESALLESKDEAEEVLLLKEAEQEAPPSTSAGAGVPIRQEKEISTTHKKTSDEPTAVSKESPIPGKSRVAKTLSTAQRDKELTVVPVDEAAEEAVVHQPVLTATADRAAPRMFRAQKAGAMPPGTPNKDSLLLSDTITTDPEAQFQMIENHIKLNPQADSIPLLRKDQVRLLLQIAEQSPTPESVNRAEQFFTDHRDILKTMPDYQSLIKKLDELKEKLKSN